MKLPKVSIITACLNSSRTISRAIESVLSQTYPHVELVIIDGNSTDGTREAIQHYTGKIAVFISEPDTGIYDAFNKGVKHATGQWICFLGSDDMLYSNNVIESMLPHFKAADETGIDYIYGKVDLVRGDGSKIETNGTSWELASKTFHEAMNINHCGAFTRSSVFEQHGLFNTRFSIAGDYEFLLRIFKAGSVPLHVDLTIAKMQTGGISNDLANTRKMAREVRLAQKLNGYNPLSFKMLYLELRVWGYLVSRKLLGEKRSLYLADLYRQVTGKRKKWSGINPV